MAYEILDGRDSILFTNESPYTGENTAFASSAYSSGTYVRKNSADDTIMSVTLRGAKTYNGDDFLAILAYVGISADADIKGWMDWLEYFRGTMVFGEEMNVGGGNVPREYDGWTKVQNNLLAFSQLLGRPHDWIGRHVREFSGTKYFYQVYVTDPVTDRTKPTAYNTRDMMRVAVMVEDLNRRLLAQGYDAGIDTSTIEMDWTLGQYPTATQLDDYMVNIIKLRDAWGQSISDALPSDIREVDYNGLNSIEKILINMKDLLEAMIRSYLYCGTFYAGEEVIR